MDTNLNIPSSSISSFSTHDSSRSSDSFTGTFNGRQVSLQVASQADTESFQKLTTSENDIGSKLTLRKKELAYTPGVLFTKYEGVKDLDESTSFYGRSPVDPKNHSLLNMATSLGSRAGSGGILKDHDKAQIKSEFSNSQNWNFYDSDILRENKGSLGKKDFEWLGKLALGRV
ncbi:hypothetical protein [Spartinivicinus poritis]|uniref:Uncharacterized protein n=1 Tax=Spartinivicinus poritis TaxID=2994640 RepID=A0ABT5UHY5_9GAMM|nr:hypothetical protein [Spartinivicinus sp. A2-2]MDE1465825.1 hypothetical protein [Spartinivicinus sp. A2-2]